MALAGWLTWHDPGRTWQKPDPSRTQTCNRRVRRATPYPLGHGHGWWKSDQHSVVLGQHGVDSDHDCTKKHPKNRGPAMALVAFCLLWRCCTGMLHAAHSLLCRRCLLQVRRDRDAYALAFCSSSGKRVPPCVLRLECITQHAGQSQQLLEAIHELALVSVGEKRPP